MDCYTSGLKRIRKTSTRFILLEQDCIPIRLLEAIEKLELSRIQKRKAFRLVSMLLKRASFHNNDLEKFIDMPVKYLELVFSKHYHKGFLNALKDAGIIECSNTFQPGSKLRKGVSKSYRVNSALLDGDLCTIQYDNTYYPTNTTYTSLLCDNNTSDVNPPYIYLSFSQQQVFCDLMTLRINEAALNEQIHLEVLGVNRDRLICDREIQQSTFKVNNTFTGQSYHINRSTALKYAAKMNCNVVQDGDRFYIASVEDYLRKKRQNLQFSYQRQVYNLSHNIFYATRNETNSRLDHNLTSLPKCLLQIIKIDNDLIEIDVKNSQFAIHAWLLKKSFADGQLPNDVKLYCEMSSNGSLYEKLAASLGVNRLEAKSFMINLAFGSHRKSNAVKNIFREQFPNVLTHIDSYKKTYGKNSFAIRLQKLEAEIFVDKIYPKLKEAGLFCLTKHDSLVIKKENASLVLTIMQDCFNEIEFNCGLSIG